MSQFELIGLAGFAVAATVMLLVTQTKERVSWPGWLVPAVVVLPFAGLTGFAVVEEGLFGFWSMIATSFWGLQLWFDRLVSVTVAFFLLQNRARAVGMKSEAWVLAVIFTGSIGLLLMVARTVDLERRMARPQR
ncbi:MAG: hypothetical protein EA356_06390 [Geminicoccaceae bacterium]|nr:MAG: hypothetical protein EA356_06390 [Geminicoccaceae bacterium]